MASSESNTVSFRLTEEADLELKSQAEALSLTKHALARQLVLRGLQISNSSDDLVRLADLKESLFALEVSLRLAIGRGVGAILQDVAPKRNTTQIREWVTEKIITPTLPDDELGEDWKIADQPAARGKYYFAYVKESERESAGEYLGTGAAALGLAGKIDERAFQTLADGFHPITGESLIKHGAIRKDLSHTPAWDYTLALNKDFSVLLLFPEFHKQLMNALWASTKAVVKDLEQNAAYTRRGHGGAMIEKCKLVASVFIHFSSRAADPQLHVHLIIFNAAPRISDNSVGTILPQPLYDRQTTAQLLFNTVFATNLKNELKISATVGETPGSFVIPEIPRPLIKGFSTRRMEIREKLEEWGASGPRAAELAALATRKPKIHMALSDLRIRWASIAKLYGYDLNEIKETILRQTKKQVETVRTDGELRKGDRSVDDHERILADEHKRATPTEAPQRIGPASQPTNFKVLANTAVPSIARGEGDASKATQDVPKKELLDFIASKDSKFAKPTVSETAGPNEPKRGTNGSTADAAKNSRVNTDLSPGIANGVDEEKSQHHPDIAEATETLAAAERTRPVSNSLNKAKSKIDTGESALRNSRIQAAILTSLTRSAIAAGIPSSCRDKLIDRVIDDYDRKVRRAIEKISPATTKAEAEKVLPDILANAEVMAKDLRHCLPADSVRSGVTGKMSGRENDAALIDVLTKRGAVVCVDGIPGVNARAFAAAIDREYIKAGFNVRTFTASSTGASALESAVRREVLSVRQLIMRLKTTPLEVGSHHLQQTLRAAIGKSILERIAFDSKSVIVITDAQMLASKDAAKIVAEAKAASAKVILIGSLKHSARREPHNVFTEISNRVEKVSLCDSAIQTQAWMKTAVKQAAIGDIRGATSEYLLADRLHLAADHKSALKELVSHWETLKRKEQNGKTLVIAATDRDAHALNKMMQRSRLLSGGLGLFLRQKIGGGDRVRGGDRVLFHVSSKHFGFRGGDLGTVIRVTSAGLRVKLDRRGKALIGKPAIRVNVPRALLKGVALGYAVTAKEAQDLACEKTLILQKSSGEGATTFLTQISRAEKDSRIFSTARAVGEDVENLKRSFNDNKLSNAPHIASTHQAMEDKLGNESACNDVVKTKRKGLKI